MKSIGCIGVRRPIGIGKWLGAALSFSDGTESWRLVANDEDCFSWQHTLTSTGFAGTEDVDFYVPHSIDAITPSIPANNPSTPSTSGTQYKYIAQEAFWIIPGTSNGLRSRVHLTGGYVLYERETALNVWEEIDAEIPEVTGARCRLGVRDGNWVCDIELTATGFAGVEDTDWEIASEIEYNYAKYWELQSEVLFFAMTSGIAHGKLYNQKSGATDFLTVTGAAGSYTFQCPNTAPYIAADTDRIWFNTDVLQRTATEAELIGYDFTRTIVKYQDSSPYAIEAIMILSSDVDTAKMRDNFHLSVWWSGILSASGNLKGNRTSAKSSWINYYSIIFDGNSIAWYDPLATGGAIRDGAGVESAYWDMLVGGSTLSAEMDSGVISVYGIYLITATTADFFYAGCNVGDTFVCPVAKTLRAADRRVKQYLGNHISQYDVAKRPVNQVFDGTSQFMTTLALSIVQPTFIYAAIKQKSWTNGEYIWDGGSTAASKLIQVVGGGTQYYQMGSGANLSTPSEVVQPTDQWQIFRVLYNGANSKLTVDDEAPVVGNAGTTDMGIFTLAARGSPANYANIEVGEIILRKVVESESNDTVIYNYLKNKWIV